MLSEQNIASADNYAKGYLSRLQAQQFSAPEAKPEQDEDVPSRMKQEPVRKEPKPSRSPSPDSASAATTAASTATAAEPTPPSRHEEFHSGATNHTETGITDLSDRTAL